VRGHSGEVVLGRAKKHAVLVGGRFLIFQGELCFVVGDWQDIPSFQRVTSGLW